MTTLKQPPIFNPNGGDSYMNWKSDIEIWQLFTKEESKRLGPAVYLSLQGDARDAVRAMDKKDIGKDNGVNLIIAELDKVFMKDETTRAFCAFKEFVEYRRQAGVNFTKFIIEFNQKYNEVKQHKMELVDGVLGYFLLAAANLTSEHERLVRATSKLEFKDINDKLQKVFGEFGDAAASDDSPSSLPVKEECMFTRGYRGRGGRGSFRGSNRGARGSGRSDGAWKKFASNPKDADGNIMRCFECESTKHLVNECPHRKGEKVEEANLTVHLTLISATERSGRSQNMMDTLGRAILDTACTKTVAGKQWMNEYVKMLGEKERNLIEKTARASKSLYRFGDGDEQRGLQEVDIPVLIGSKRMKIAVDIVDANIPLLISKPLMSEVGMVIDTKEHTLEFDGQRHQLLTSSSGHYMIPVSEFTTPGCKVVLHMQLADCTVKEKKEKAVKLHRQFAHASKERLTKLLKNAGCEDKELRKQIEVCCDECEFCNMYRQPKPKPIVAMPKASKFNQVVSMDLKELVKGKRWILHIVDEATRYTAASIVDTKRSDVIVKNVMKIWIAYFGRPDKIHSDCGGEFSSEIFRELNDKFGIETSSTPAEAPFNNGVVERGNKVLYESMMKTKDDVKCDDETALAWAVSAKNCLQNVYGYSPNQLVMSQNVSLPSVIDDKPPALESHTSSDLIRINLNDMHSARENFIKAESSEKIRRALLKNVRSYSEVHYQPGDKVYYKRRMRKGWSGPARVLGKEGNFVLIRQGAAFYRCHPCDLMKESAGQKSEAGNQLKSMSTNVAKEVDSYPSRSRISLDTDSLDEDSDADVVVEDIEDCDVTNEELPVINEHADNAMPEHTDAVSAETDVIEATSQQLEEIEVPGVEIQESVVDAAELNDTVSVQPSVDAEDNNGDHATLESESVSNDVTTDGMVEGEPESSGLFNSKTRPKRNTVIQYALEDNHINKAAVLSYQPKRGGVNGDWVNVRLLGQNEPSSVDWTDVLWWRQIENTVEQVLVLNKIDLSNQDVIDAKEKEVSNLKENDVFDVVEFGGQDTVSSRWIINKRTDENGENKIKARLVARGFEENLLDKRVDSPTCSRQALRLVFSTASTMEWEINSLDIKSAFLQGKELIRDVFVMPPKDICEVDKIWKLKRCLYGLNDAPREWYNKLSEKLKEFGGTISMYDNSLFMWHKDDVLVGIMTIHVDDLIYCGTDEWRNTVIEKIKTEFKISKSGTRAFCYVGLDIEQNGLNLYVTQQHYIQSLEEMKINDDRKKDIHAKLTDKEKKNLRAICGQLLWVSSQTRPDAAFETCRASNSGKDATVETLIAANKTIKQLKSEELKLCYPALGSVKDLKVVAYGDATHASLPSGESQGANMIFLAGNNRVAPIAWKSKKLERVTKSPLASEVSAIADAADTGHLIASMAREIYKLENIPKVMLYTDSKSLKQNLESTKVIQDPRLRVDMARLKQMVDLVEIEVKWVPS